jgi:ferredoxin
MLKGWKNRLEGVCKTIAAREKSKIESSSLLLNFSRNIRMVSHAIEFAKQLLLKGIGSLGFTFNEDCNACGICERICPVHNIEIVDGKPIWSDHCAGCFACLNWCPKEAISVGGLDLGIEPYHHPEVKLSDMMRQR